MDINGRYKKEMMTYPMLLLVVLFLVLALVPPVKPVPSVEVTEEAALPDYYAFLDALAMRESTDNYQAVNRYNYLGRYQLGAPALKDAGFMDKKGRWTSKANQYGIYTQRDFLFSQVGQDAAVAAYHKKLCDYIRYYGLSDYLGQTYCEVPVTHSGLLAACHLVGVGSMKKALASGKATYDGNRVPASEYMELFGGYDVSVVWGEDPPPETTT